jgi:hypothetical protein
MACEERDRLTKIYISAIAENNDSVGARAGKASWSDTWREKVRGMRESYRCWKKQAGPSNPIHLDATSDSKRRVSFSAKLRTGKKVRLVCPEDRIAEGLSTASGRYLINQVLAHDTVKLQTDPLPQRRGA